MGTQYEGKLLGKGLKIGIIHSRWNDFMGNKLYAGAWDTLVRLGVDEADIDTAKVPGSFEIPLAAHVMANKEKYDAIICLGVLIRGGTIHFDLIASEVAKGIAQVSRNSGIPITFGVITTENIEQAIERSGSKAGNKGAEAASSAIEMANLIKALK